MAVRPFQFHLKKVDAEAQALSEALTSFLPRTGHDKIFPQMIRESLIKHVGCPMSFRVERLTDMPAEQFVDQLATPAAVVVVGMPPLEKKMLIDVDCMLATRIIDRMLGGRAEEPHDVRPLSDIEQGVLQYLVLQILSGIRHVFGHHARIHFRYEQFHASSEPLRLLFAPREHVAVMMVRVSVDDADGFVRLVFPHPFIEAAFLDAQGIGEDRREEKTFLLERLSHYDYVKCPLWAEAGSGKVTPQELAALEIGDVIVLDQSRVVLEKGKPSGEVVVRAGWGLAGGFRASFMMTAEHASCRLIESYRGE